MRAQIRAVQATIDGAVDALRAEVPALRERVGTTAAEAQARIEYNTSVEGPLWQNTFAKRWPKAYQRLTT